MNSWCPSAKRGWFPGLFWLSSYLLLNLVTGRQGLCHRILITKCTQNPFPQTDNFLLIKARAKILLSCHRDSWFISPPPSFHIFLGKHPAWHGPCRLAQPRWPRAPGEADYSGRAVLAKPPLLVLHICIYSFFFLWFGMEGAGKPTSFPGSWRVHLGKPPTLHMAPLQGKGTTER